MDPWLSCCQVDVTVSEKILTKFEDNFTPAVFEKLPDSAEYLAILEAKLRRLQNDPNVLRQLAAKKELYMKQLLNTENTPQTQSLEYVVLDEPVSNSQIVRTLLPHKQALNQGELAQLVKFDQLSGEDHSEELKRGSEENHTPS